MLKSLFSGFSKSDAPINLEEALIAHRIQLFRDKKVNCILDVGANAGQYAESVLSRYNCRMISFEPMKPVFDVLTGNRKRFDQWETFNIGLGDKNEEVAINVSRNSYSSSILELKKETTAYDDDIGFIGKQVIEVKRLDSIWNELNINETNVLLKIDTQGYEEKVLHGCEGVMHKIMGIQIELSVVELYENEPPFDKMYKMIKDYGFDLYIIEPGYKDPATGKLLQMEAVFLRSKWKY